MFKTNLSCVIQKKGWFGHWKGTFVPHYAKAASAYCMRREEEEQFSLVVT